MDYYIIVLTNCITQWHIFRKTVCEMFPKQKHYGLEYRDNFYVFYPSLYLFLKSIPVDTGRKLNVHKTFRRRPGCLLNVLCTFNLRPVSTGMNCFSSYFFINNLWSGLKYSLTLKATILKTKRHSFTKNITRILTWSLFWQSKGNIQCYHFIETYLDVWQGPKYGWKF